MAVIKLIAFVGKMGSGKTTAARHLVVKHQFVRIRFADGLKSMLVNGLGIGWEYIDGDLKNAPCPELVNQTGRHGMITLGTEWGRNLIHPDIWVKALEKEFLLRIDEGRELFVIDDCRFLNEADWIHKVKLIENTEAMRNSYSRVEAKLIRIVRQHDEYTIDHQSETEQDKIIDDGVLYNSGDLNSLYAKIDKFLFS